MPTPIARLRVSFALLVLVPVALTAQEPTGSVNRPGLVAVQATTPGELRDWDGRINRMVRDRQLVVLGSVPDPEISGRTHESLGQFYQGLPVFGATLSRQAAQGVSVSIIGTVFENISVASSPALSASAITQSLAATTGALLVGLPPQLLIFPTPVGAYRLAYLATMSDLKTYIVDAESGGVLWTIDEVKTQSQVGVGTGALGDTKKLSATQAAGGFRTQDQLRPAPIRTFDTLGSEATLNRLLQPPGATVESDFPVDADNTWVNPPVVDAHVHSGWMEDYLAKRMNWTGVDNRGGTITAAVHTGLVNNAYFISSPFGADGRGMFVYGRTPGGAPITTLDIVGHEMMHGVTHASLVQRTGRGLLDALFIDRPGPSSFTFQGATYPCATTVVVLSDGRRLPLWCSDGRYVLLSNHPGAINEGFSDVFGIAAEFFYQPVGTGPLQADYKTAEDVAGLGWRAADTPGSVTVSSTLGPRPYPDHASQGFSFIAAVAEGTRENPTSIVLLNWVLVGGQLASLPSADSGGVHYNATILSHAFYLAVEGGRNATSGITVQGVGAANRAQIERAFFRAMTLLMPNVPSMSTAAQAVVQAAIDLYGANSAAATASRQAMQAVGLVN